MKNLMLLVVCLLGFQVLSAESRLMGSTPAQGCSVALPPAGEITILIAYTTSAAIAAGGPKNIKRDVDNGLRLLNDALVNNNIPYSVRAIVEYVEVEYGAAPTNSAVTDLLAELRKTNGKFNKVHQFRQQKKADIVCLVFSGYTMGMADLNGAMMVCHYSAFGDSYVFPHEFGHVMGATHEAGMNFNFGENQSYRTIATNGGVSIPYFSEPRSITMTIAGTSRTFSIGDATHNNAGTIRTNAPAKSTLGDPLTPVASVANAAAAKLVDPLTAPMPGGGAPPYTISSFTVALDGNMTIRYQCSDAVAFTIEGYDPNLFGGFGSNLDPSKPEMTVRHWGSAYPGDRYVLKINGVEVKSYLVP